MITIKKAISVLPDILDYVRHGESPEEHHAIKLGIEALKHIDELRKGFFGHVCPLLPGETEDNSEEAQEIEPEATYP